MAEYMSREDYCETACGKENREGYKTCHNCSMLNVPSANVQPVRRGRWIKQEGFWNKNTVKCSLCGNYLDMNGVNGGRSDANYCPNCGADMRGEDDA